MGLSRIYCGSRRLAAAHPIQSVHSCSTSADDCTRMSCSTGDLNPLLDNEEPLHVVSNLLASGAAEAQLSPAGAWHKGYFNENNNPPTPADASGLDRNWLHHLLHSTFGRLQCGPDDRTSSYQLLQKAGRATTGSARCEALSRGTGTCRISAEEHEPTRGCAFRIGRSARIYRSIVYGSTATGRL